MSARQFYGEPEPGLKHGPVFKKQEEAFLALLDDTVQKRYDAMRDEQDLLSTFYERAQFLAGFRLAMELSR